MTNHPETRRQKPPNATTIRSYKKMGRLFTTTTQHYQALLRENPETEPKVQEKFEQGLTEFLRKQQEHDLLIMGDFNMERENKFLCHLREEFNLADVIYEKLGAETAKLSTYKWGSKRVDHVLTSWEILEEITEVHIGAYNDLNSDHRPISFKVKWSAKADKLLGRQSQQRQFKKG